MQGDALYKTVCTYAMLILTGVLTYDVLGILYYGDKIKKREDLSIEEIPEFVEEQDNGSTKMHDNKKLIMESAPVSFNDFIGQQNAVTLMKMHIKASLINHNKIPHVLLEGPGGTGKTTMAMCIANEIGTRLYVTTPSTFKNRESVINFFFDENNECIIEEGDIIFIDEIHRVREQAAIYLYSAMQDYYMDNNGDILDIPHFTMIGATTDAGMLPPPFRDRFKIKVTMQQYDIKDLAEIVINFKHISKEVALQIAQRSCGVPRLAKALSDNVIAYATANNEGDINKECVYEVCKLMEIDSNGLSVSARRVIKYFKETDNKAIGVGSLSKILNISKETLDSEVFPVLYNLGILITQGTRGKCLSNKGLNYKETTEGG